MFGNAGYTAFRSFQSNNPASLCVRESEVGLRRCPLDCETHLGACRGRDGEALFRCPMGLHRLIIPLNLPDGPRGFFIMCGFKTRAAPAPPLVRHGASAGFRCREF